MLAAYGQEPCNKADILGRTLASLDHQSLGRAAVVSRALRRLSELNIVWKVSIFRLLLRGFFIPPLYKESLRIPLNAPMHGTWLALDPWWQGTGAALQLRFNRDRTVEHIGRSLLGTPSPEFHWMPGGVRSFNRPQVAATPHCVESVHWARLSGWSLPGESFRRWWSAAHL
eukprot:s1882_g6.t1